MGKLPNVRAKAASATLALVWILAAHAAQAGLDRSIERTMDRQAREAIEANYKVVQDPMLVAFIDRLGQQMAEKSGRRDVKFVFKILDTPEVNALALPAGHIYVTTGLLEFADSTDEVAAILGHEVAHVAARHSLSQFKKQFWADLVLGVLGLPPTAATVTQVAFGLHMLRHSRKDETEADRLGARYAYAAGYDPRHLKRFMDKLAKKKGKVSTLESYLSTHPTSQRRSQRLAELPELDTSRAETAAAIGAGYARRHLLNHAVLRYRQAAAASPQDPALHRALAQAYARLGEREAAAAEAARVASLSPGEVLHIAPLEATTVAPPRDVKSAVAAAEKRVKEVLAAAPRGEELAAAAEQLAASHKALAERKKSAERSLSMRASSSDPRQRDALRRAGHVLRRVENALPIIGAVKERMQADAEEVRAIGEQLASSLSAETDPARQAQIASWVMEFSRQVERRNAERSEAAEAARDAAAAADRALTHLNEALSYQSHLLSREPSLASTTGARQLEKAEEEAKKAVEFADRARSLQASCQAQSMAWRLNLKAVSASPQQLREYEAFVAESLGLKPEEVSAAAARAGGLGSAILSLLCAPAPTVEAVAAEPGQRKTDEQKDEQSGPKDEKSPGYGLLLLGLLADNIERDLQAGVEWKIGAGEESVLP